MHPLTLRPVPRDERKNRITNSPETYCTNGNPITGHVPFKANIGHWCLSQAYGGVGVERHEASIALEVDSLGDHVRPANQARDPLHVDADEDFHGARA